MTRGYLTSVNTNKKMWDKFGKLADKRETTRLRILEKCMNKFTSNSKFKKIEIEKNYIYPLHISDTTYLNFKAAVFGLERRLEHRIFIGDVINYLIYEELRS